MKDYKHRNKIIEDMGYQSYKEYLENDEDWLKYKKARIDGTRKCEICNKNVAYTLHHMNYSERTLTFDKKQMHKSLIPICRDCHHYIEFDDNGNKVFNLREIIDRSKFLRSKYGTIQKGRCVRCQGLVPKRRRCLRGRLCKKCADELKMPYLGYQKKKPR